MSAPSVRPADDRSTVLSEWDDFFVHNPASRHRRRLLHALIRRHGVDFRSVLDVGCGDGRLLEEMQRAYGCAIFGIELHKTSASARLAGRLNGLYQIDIQKTPLGKTFDLVICTEVLEHLPQAPVAAASLARMCGGAVLVTVPAGPLRETDRRMGHVRHYDGASLRALMEGAGFQTIDCFQWGWPFHSLYRWALDLSPDKIMDEYGRSRYGWKEKAVCRLLYGMFFLNSHRTGCQLFYLGRKAPGR